MSHSTASPAEPAASTARGWWRRAWNAAAQTARLAIGIPDYDRYLQHVQRHHPELTPMDRNAFFRNRMEARYGKGRSRCC